MALCAASGIAIQLELAAKRRQLREGPIMAGGAWLAGLPRKARDGERRIRIEHDTYDQRKRADACAAEGVEC